ncbi:hypothetical protein [Yersinia ruckeri]|uniref:hypothetical protein n=1 Tax=Yersinia ruckeri TaxID=29486 RepID=UPI002238FF15|nr:hypothetical protein [Yersinia ruckeri]MCW6598873.1 hypothetical protein [Yersinia ruckeri]
MSAPQELSIKEFQTLSDKVRRISIKNISKWDARFILRAASISLWSKDPSTQVGCVLVRPDKTVASEGYNGLAPQIEDTEERLNDRAIKYAFIDHAEENALDYCRDPYPRTGYTAYVYPIHSCSKCFAKLLKQGVTRIVTTSIVHSRVSVNLPHIFKIIEEANKNGIDIRIDFLDADAVDKSLVKLSASLLKLSKDD